MDKGTHKAAMAAGIACALLFNAALGAENTAGWKPLFNGKNLKGWTMQYASKVPADAPPVSTLFKVEGGEIHVYPTQPAGSAQPNAYLETDADYKDYVVSLEYRLFSHRPAHHLNTFHGLRGGLID